jgi:hypothetical protein
VTPLVEDRAVADPMPTAPPDPEDLELVGFDESRPGAEPEQLLGLHTDSAVDDDVYFPPTDPVVIGETMICGFSHTNDRAHDGRGEQPVFGRAEHPASAGSACTEHSATRLAITTARWKPGSLAGRQRRLNSTATAPGQPCSSPDVHRMATSHL